MTHNKGIYPIALKQFATVSIDAMIEQYMMLLPTGHPKPQKVKLHHKFMFLSHLAISSAISSKDNKFQLNAERLDDVIGTEYKLMIAAMVELRLLDVDSDYVPTEYCRNMSLLNFEIVEIHTVNVAVAKYIDSWKTKTSEARGDYAAYLEVLKTIIPNHKLVRSYSSPLTEDFKDKYNRTLKMLHFKDNDVVTRYVNEKFMDNYNCHSFYYYKECVDKFKKSEHAITSVDKNGRIYHCLTNMPKDLKQFVNIKFQVDLANSHPMILCYLLINELNVSMDVLKVIYNIKISREEYEITHNVLQKISNELSNRNIRYTGELDVLEYIVIANKGWIWDDFMVLSGLPRDEVKKKAFTEIFYHPYDIAKHTMFGRAFIEKYPTVYAVISKLKKECNLARKLMSIESAIMRKVLQECFKQNFAVLSVHDAIIAADVEDNAALTAGHIRIIINGIFKAFGLHPCTHVDEYDDTS